MLFLRLERQRLDQIIRFTPTHIGMYVYIIGHSPLGLFQDQCKQTMVNKHNWVKNPNWQEADQLAIYKRNREAELGATENNIS